jgi:hypothetical protein
VGGTGVGGTVVLVGRGVAVAGRGVFVAGGLGVLLGGGCNVFVGWAGADVLPVTGTIAVEVRGLVWRN